MTAPGSSSPVRADATRLFRDARDFLLAHREDSEAAYRGRLVPAFETFNWATDWFDALATEQGECIALHVVEPGGKDVLRDTRISYAELGGRSRQVAGWLWARGVRPGDRLLVVLGNVAALWELMLASMRLGTVMIPVSTALPREELADQVRRSRARVVVASTVDTPRLGDLADDCLTVAVDLGDGRGGAPGWEPYALTHDHATLDEVAEGTADALPVTRPDDPMLGCFTSGTSGRPDLVVHSHAYPVGHLSTMYWIGLQPGDVHLNIAPSGSAKHAWSSLFAPFNAGATVLVNGFHRTDARLLLRMLTERAVTTFCAPPTVWRMLAREDLSAWSPTVRELVAAGEPLNPGVIERVRDAWGISVRDGFGQTETTAQVGNPPGQRVKPGSMGRPLPGYSIVLVDPLTGEVGDDGEICVEMSPRPPGVMSEYDGDPQRTAEAMDRGVFHTGDLASRDADGYLTYVGRVGDVFSSGDHRISPVEVESVLEEHPAVAEVAVVPSPDPVRGSVPKAYVTPAPGHPANRETALDILRRAHANLAPHLTLRLLEFVPVDKGLPRTVSGKIRRAELRAAEAGRVTGAGPGGPAGFDAADFPELAD